MCSLLSPTDPINIVTNDTLTSSFRTTWIPHVQTGDGDNHVQTAGGDDTVITGTGDDTVKTGGGDDVVETGGGDDTIIGGSGNGDDVYDGGLGSDTVLYPSATHSITVDLNLADRSDHGGKRRGNDRRTPDRCGLCG